MKQGSYDERDYSFGQAMLTLRSDIGLTQEGLAGVLGVSRRAVGSWETGDKYPNASHLKEFIVLALAHNAFHTGREADEIRAFWRSAHQKVLLDETWLAHLLTTVSKAETSVEHADPPQIVPLASTTTPRDLASKTTNLPFQPTPFFGRSTELQELGRILGDPSCHLLTLLGPGGVGKTRLATEAAARMAESFADGVAFVPLAQVATPQQIVSAISDVLSLRFGGRGDGAAWLLGFLRDLQMLLILDNFEHLLDGTDLVQDILRQAPNITILVTSRERLSLQAEWLLDVGGLSYPPERSHRDFAAPDVRAVAEYSAVKLFVQSATRVQPGFALTEKSLSIVASICRYLAGMPLAIELAASSVRMLPLAEIERQLRQSLDLLATNLRDMPPRHRSMRAVFDQSWQLLSASERLLFSHMAVFRGGCTGQAAEQVAGATLPELWALVDKSLLRQERDWLSSGSEDAQVAPRFVLLEPIREYATERLTAEGAAELAQRHANYYLARADMVAAQWESPAADPLIEQFEHDYDNVRAALQWALDHADSTFGLRLAIALRKFWQRCGYYSEGRAWMDALLALNPPIDDPAALSIRARGLHTAAWLASDQHDYVRATQLYEESIALRRALGEPEGEDNLLAPAARQARAAGQYRRATSLLEDVLARHRAQGDRGSLSSGGLGLGLYELGLVLREQGDFARATALFEECLQLHRELGDREGMTVGLLGLGDLARDQVDTDGVRRYCAQSMAISGELGMQWARGFALNNLALAAFLDDDIVAAADLISESVALFRALDAESSLAEIYISQGYILWAHGDLVGAYEVMSASVRLALELGPRLLAAIALEGLAGLVAEWGAAGLAVQVLAAAAAQRNEMGTPPRPVDIALETPALRAARSTLGTALFAAMWQAGQEQPLDSILNSVRSLATMGDRLRTLDSPSRPQGTSD